MPQMSPLMWLNLMCSVLLLFLIFFCLTYYMKLPGSDEKVSLKGSAKMKVWGW